MNAYMYVFDTLADWECGHITAELNSGRFFKKHGDKLPVTTVANSKNAVKTMGGLSVIPDVTIDQLAITSDDLLILPGGNTWFDPCHDPILKIVAELLPKGLTVGAICGATAALAKTGLLNSRKHTSNALSYLEQTCPNYKGHSLYQQVPAVADGYLITSSGMAPLEFAYQIIQKIGVFKHETLEAWYGLYHSKAEKYYSDLIKSMS